MTAKADAVEEFGERLRELLTEVYGPLTNGEGYTPAEIAAAEASLGLAFPVVLRACYQIAGKHPAFRDGLQNLLPLSNLEVRDFGDQGKGLLCLAEMQWVVFFVIGESDLGTLDPPIYQGNESEKALHPECSRLSSFLLKTLCWNAIQILGEGGSTTIRRRKMEALCAGLSVVESAAPGEEEDRMIALRKPGIVVCLFPQKAGLGQKFDLHAAAKSAEDLERFEKEFRISLSWY